MTAEDRPDPDEYTPGPDPVTAAEEYQPEVVVSDPTREANPADVADQAIELPSDVTDPDEVGD